MAALSAPVVYNEQRAFLRFTDSNLKPEFVIRNESALVLSFVAASGRCLSRGPSFETLLKRCRGMELMVRNYLKAKARMAP